MPLQVKQTCGGFFISSGKRKTYAAKPLKIFMLPYLSTHLREKCGQNSGTGITVLHLVRILLSVMPMPA
jgi:hypothetical protein